MSEWEISIRDGKGNLRSIRFFGIDNEEAAREAASRFSERWGGAEIESVERVGSASNAETMSLTGVVTPL